MKKPNKFELAMLIFFLFTFIVSIILKYAISEEVSYLFGRVDFASLSFPA